MFLAGCVTCTVCVRVGVVVWCSGADFPPRPALQELHSTRCGRHKALQEKYDKIAAAEAERERIANEKAEKKRKVDTEKATALFETVSALWNDQVDDELWADRISPGADRKMKKLIAEKPEMARDLFRLYTAQARGTRRRCPRLSSSGR